MLKIRKMIKSDIDDLHTLFKEQGWDKPYEILEKYYLEQESGARGVFIAANEENQPVGYATLLPNDSHGAFKDKNIPTVCDFNVFKKYQKNGAGTAILDAIEESVKASSDIICLGVGLHSGYGSAQRMYIKRGYVPDGSGVWYNNKNLEEGEACFNDDDLIIYLSKRL